MNFQYDPCRVRRMLVKMEICKYSGEGELRTMIARPRVDPWGTPTCLQLVGPLNLVNGHHIGREQLCSRTSAGPSAR